MLKSKKEAEKHAAKMKAMSQDRSHSTSREAELQSEVDKCMVCLIPFYWEFWIRRAKFLIIGYPQMFNVQDEYAKYRAHEVYAL